MRWTSIQTWCIKCTFFISCLYTLRRDASLQSYSFKLTWQITWIRKWSHSIHLSRDVRLTCFLLCTKWDKFSTMCINWDTVDRMSNSKIWCLSWLSINEDYHCDILKSVAWWHWWVDVKKRGRRRIVLAREREGKQRSNPLMDLSQKHTCSNRQRQKFVQLENSWVPQLTCTWMSGARGLGNQTTCKGYLVFNLN